MTAPSIPRSVSINNEIDASTRINQEVTLSTTATGLGGEITYSVTPSDVEKVELEGNKITFKTVEAFTISASRTETDLWDAKSAESTITFIPKKEQVATPVFSVESGEVAPSKVEVPTSDNAGTKISEQKDGTVTVTVAGLGTATNISPAVFAEGQVYRLYNPNTGEHFYTKNPQERNALAALGWNYEADQMTKTIASTEEGAAPVYRVYNPNSGLHHYTTNKAEAVMLKNIGWNYEGISMYAFSGNSGKGTAMYRVYCPFPNANGQNQHVYTTSEAEVKALEPIQAFKTKAR